MDDVHYFFQEEWNMNMTEEKALQGFGAGIDCSQAVLAEAAPQVGLEENAARKLAAAFGGGMWHGQTCGCVTGALMALGMKYGNCEPGDMETKNAFLAKKAEFEKDFAAENGSLICRELLGYDLSTEEGMARIQEEKLLETRCPGLVCSACRHLEALL